MRSTQFLTSATGICLMVAAAARPMEPLGSNQNLKDILSVQRNNADGPRVTPPEALQAQRNNAAPLNEELRPISISDRKNNNNPARKPYSGPSNINVGNVRIVFPFNQGVSDEELYRIYNLVLSYVDYYEQNPNRVTTDNARMVEAYHVLKRKFEEMGFVDPLRGLRDASEGTYHHLRDQYMVREQYTRERALNGFQSDNEGEVRKQLLKVERDLTLKDFIVDPDDWMHLSEPTTMISYWIFPIPREQQGQKQSSDQQNVPSAKEEEERIRTGLRPEFRNTQQQQQQQQVSLKDLFPKKEFKAPSKSTTPPAEEEGEWPEYNEEDFNKTPAYQNQQQDFFYNSDNSYDYNKGIDALDVSADDIEDILAKTTGKPSTYYHPDVNVPDPDNSNPGNVNDSDDSDDEEIPNLYFASQNMGKDIKIVDKEPYTPSLDVNQILSLLSKKAPALDFKNFNSNDLFSTPIKKPQPEPQQYKQPEPDSDIAPFEFEDELDGLLGTPAPGLKQPISPMPHKNLRPIGLIRSGHVEFTPPKGSRSAPTSMNDLKDDVPKSANLPQSLGDIDQDSIEEVNRLRRTFNTLPRMVEAKDEEEELEEESEWAAGDEWAEEDEDSEAYEGDEEAEVEGDDGRQ